MSARSEQTWVLCIAFSLLDNSSGNDGPQTRAVRKAGVSTRVASPPSAVCYENQNSPERHRGTETRSCFLRVSVPQWCSGNSLCASRSVLVIASLPGRTPDSSRVHLGNRL